MSGSKPCAGSSSTTEGQRLSRPYRFCAGSRSRRAIRVRNSERPHRQALGILDKRLAGRTGLWAIIDHRRHSLCGYLYYPAREFGFDIGGGTRIGAWLERIKKLPGWAHPLRLSRGTRCRGGERLPAEAMTRDQSSGRGRVTKALFAPLRSPMNAQGAENWILAGTCGSSMAFIDASVVNVALPAIERDSKRASL